MAVAVQTVAVPGAGTSVVVLSWKVATKSLSARTTRLPPASDYGPAVTLTDRQRRKTGYTKDIPPVVEPPWRRPLWAGRLLTVPLACHSQQSEAVSSGQPRTTPWRAQPAPFCAFAGDDSARSGFGSRGRGLGRCRAAPWRLAYEQVVTEDEPHPPAELVTIARTLRATSPSPAVPRRALSTGRHRSSTDNHGPCRCPPSCRISLYGADRGSFPSSRYSGREPTPGRRQAVRGRR
jgi:hypothetical protein